MILLILLVIVCMAFTPQNMGVIVGACIIGITIRESMHQCISYKSKKYEEQLDELKEENRRLQDELG